MTNDIKKARERGEWTNDEFERVIDMGGEVMHRMLDPTKIEPDDVIRTADGFAVVGKVLTNGVDAVEIGSGLRMFLPFTAFTFIGKNWSPR